MTPEEDEPLVQARAEEDAGDDDEEEADGEEECGWCKWMKGGSCKSEFQVWLDCVDGLRAKGREDVEVCADVMGPLWDCMAKHKDYYAPQLDSLASKREAAGGEGGPAAEGAGAKADGGPAASAGGEAGADPAPKPS